MSEDIVKVFEKSRYAGPPSERIKQMLEKLACLGNAVIACREGEDPDISSNILGTIHLGEDGGDPVLRGKKAPSGECECHVHVRWDRIHDFALRKEDVGYGPEPVIYLLKESGEPMVRIFYPKKSFEEVEAVLASREVRPAKSPPRPFRLVFTISFPSDDALLKYAAYWSELSQIIQKEPGARGTRLHKIAGPTPTILVIAEWGSAEARMAAYRKMNAEVEVDTVVAKRIMELGGTLGFIFIAKADEIDAVFP